MKKVSLAILAVLMICNVFAQEFMGVKVDGTMDVVMKNMSAKGFTLKSKEPKDNLLIMKGKVGTEDVELYAVFTPVSKVCWKFAIYFDEETDWYSLKKKYNDNFEMLKNKYGEPTSSYDFFSKPYYEGDGYEMTAVKVGKATYSAFWTDMAIQITTSGQVTIGYENPTNRLKKRAEVDEAKKNAF